MGPRTGGDPLVGEVKMDTNAEDYRALVEGYADGSLTSMTPAIFYEGFLITMQIAAPPAGNIFESKPLVSTEKAAKKPKYEEEEAEEGEFSGVEEVSAFWHPLVRKWLWTKDNGHKMIAINFNPGASMSPGTTAGIDIHAVGASCSITADWPKEFYSLEGVRQYYGKDALKDSNLQRMLNAEEDHLKKLMASASDTPRATVIIHLDFPVLETKSPKSHVVTCKGTGARIITIQLASTNVPNFAAKQVLSDEIFD